MRLSFLALVYALVMICAFLFCSDHESIRILECTGHRHNHCPLNHLVIHYIVYL